MSKFSRLRPSPALIVALVALVAAMSGAAIALPGKNSVKKNDIAKGAVTGKKIAEGAVKSKQIKGKSIKGNRLKDKAIKAKQIADDAIASEQVEENGLNTSDLSDLKVLGAGGANLIRTTATHGTNPDATFAAAPEVPLRSKGQLSVYGKCIHLTDTDETWAAVYVKTAANGAIFWSEFGDQGVGSGLIGGNNASDFLNTNTPEDDRQINFVSTIGPQTSLEAVDFEAVGADQTHFTGQVMAAAKNGELAGGNGAYGAGNVCLFGGQVAG